MTDIELLPLPSVLLNWPHPTNHVAIRDYARANVAHATAPLQAENERLRAEAAKRDGIDPWAVLLRAQEAEARAELLAEALRELVALGHPRDPAIIAARAALRDHDQEGKDG